MLTGLVLSGGNGSRMGRDKGLINLRGDPMLSYVVDAMLGTVNEIVISVAKGEASKYDEYAEIGFEVVEDRDKNIGPIEGILCGLKASRGEYVLICPCDTPFLKREVCELLLSKASGKDAAVPFIGDKYEPVHGVFKRDAAIRAFEATLAAGKRKPSAAYDRLNLVLVDEESIRVVDPGLDSFWNLNTPEDLWLAEKRIDDSNQLEQE